MSPRRNSASVHPHAPAWGWVEQEHAFRLLAPKATQVTLVERPHPENSVQERLTPMTAYAHPHGQGWEGKQAQPLGYYRFRVEQDGQTFDVADPRSQRVARQFAPGHPTWSVAKPHHFQWRGDLRPAVAVHEAVILELHVRDFTIHPTSGVKHPGTYLGLAEPTPGAPGGINALRDLGVDCVELLPVTSFPQLEHAPEGQYQNPTRRNHWGYMPSFFLAASERYCIFGQNPEANAWIGVDADGTFHDPGDELREAIRLLHRDGIAVVLDLVFNHVSMHDDNPLLKLDPGTWFYRNPDGTLRSDSGCGNDLDTADPAMAALVVDAAVHWMRAYHIDGLRLDLAAMLDDATLTALRTETHREYARAILISEPWSMAGYRPAELARLGHTVWNDRFRNAIKGQHPLWARGFIFGQGQGGAHRQDIGALLAGWPRSLGGIFDDASLTLNYLESHDDLTLGDFVRLGLGEVQENQPVLREDVCVIQVQELRIHRLAATALLLSRGALMIAQGQEWARAKVQDNGPNQPGHLDGNSYNRDDNTNHLDWSERQRNPELVDHYRRLIALRKSWLLPALLAGQPMRLLWGNQPWAVGYQIHTPRGILAVLLNGMQTESAWFDVPSGPWWLLLGADDGHIVPTPTGVAVEVKPTAAAVIYATVK